MVVGTVGYMAPEQHGDPRRVDVRCDVYALGSILYEFTTGQPYSQVQLPPASVRPGFPPGLAAILMRALAADPVRRIPSMTALGGELSNWLETAAAAGWGEEPLPGFRAEDLDLMTGLLTSLRSDPELAVLVREQMIEKKQVVWRELVARAVARGELAASTDPSLIDEVSGGIVFMRLVVTGQKIDEQFVVHLVDDILLPVLTKDAIS